MKWRVLTEMNEYTEQKKLIEHKLVIEPDHSIGELDTVRYQTVDGAGDIAPWRKYAPSLLLIFIVIIPVLGSLVYNFVVAADRYASSAVFVVRQNKSGDGVMALMDGGGLSRADDSSYAVAEFMKSRDAIAFLNNDGFLNSVFTRESVDLFSRFPSLWAGKTEEDLYQHYQHYVDVEFDPSTGITSFEVQGFTPEDARQLAQRLLDSSENLVNELNARAKRDSIRFAEDLVADSGQKLQKVQSELTAFRNESQLLTPDAEVQVSAAVIANVMSEIAKVDIQISQLLMSAPNNPTLSELRSRRDSMQEQLESIRATLGGGANSVSTKIEAYEKIALRREIAEKEMVNATATYLKAQQDLVVSRLYIDPVVRPNLSDKSGYPTRFYNLFLMIFTVVSVYTIVRFSMKLVMEEN